MKTVACWLASCLAAFFAFGQAQAQVPLPLPPPVSIGFRNDLKVSVIVQGFSVINGMQRRGQPILVQPGKIAFENNVPSGGRIYSIYDFNQPSRVLLRDFAVPLPPGRDLGLSIQVANPGRVVLVPEKLP